jgi:E3 ubiquitin-protein ligase synoviolin
MPIQRLLRERTQSLAASLLSHRILLYFIASTLALFAAVANALKNFSNFYSVAIYLSKSSRSVLVRPRLCIVTKGQLTSSQVLANFGFLVSLFSAHIVQRLFFGTLRANEVEVLHFSPAFVAF